MTRTNWSHSTARCGLETWPGGDPGARSGQIGTDTAFMLAALAGSDAPHRCGSSCSLTVIDDIVVVSVVGVFSDSLDVRPLAVMAVLGVVVGAAPVRGVARCAPYVLVGPGLWLAAVQAGLHASIAGMLDGLLVAAQPPAREAVEGAATRFRAFRQSPDVHVGRSAKLGLARAVSVNERLQIALHPWASYLIVPLFALANAGVDLRDGVLTQAVSSRVTWAVVVALVFGKTLGVGITSLAAVRGGLGRLPAGMGFGHVFGGASLSGIAFTVSLMIANLAIDDAE